MFRIIWKYSVLNLNFVLLEFYFWLNFELKYSSDKMIATKKLSCFRRLGGEQML